MMHDLPKDRLHDPEAAERKWERARAVADLIAWLRRDAADRSGNGFWYVVETAGRDPNRIAADMLEAGIEAWCPAQKLLRRKRRSHAMETIEVALFERYMFVRTGAAESCWLGVMTFDGVRSLLGNGEQPTALPDAMIKEIRDFLDLPEAQRRYRYHAGDRVLVMHGPFGSFEATVLESENARGAVKLEVDLFGRMTSCTIGLDDLKKLG